METEEYSLLTGYIADTDKLNEMLKQNTTFKFKIGTDFGGFIFLGIVVYFIIGMITIGGGIMVSSRQSFPNGSIILIILGVFAIIVA